MRVLFKPANGLKVRHPEKKEFVLPPEGVEAEFCIEWQRLVNSGDVIPVNIVAPVAAAKGVKDNG